MISIYNKAIIKELNLRLLEQLEELESKERQGIQIVEAQNGEPTLTVQVEGKTRYLHSRYNPTYEAEKLFDSCDDIDENCNLVIYGAGLGYHIKEAIKRFPQARYYIVEPNLELLYTFLENVELKDCNIKNLEGISNNLIELDSKIPDYSFKYPKIIKILWLKGYIETFAEEFSDFRKIYLMSLKNEKQRANFLRSFQERTVTNEISNIREVLESKQLLAGDLSAWKDKTAIIVAAGPSLDEEIENLRQIKEKGMAYIFAVGSAVNTLLSNGIYADALFSYDPSEKNQIVVKKIKDEKITNIPILFGGGIGSETLKGYTGIKFYVKNGSNYILNYFLKSELDTPEVKLGPTISIMAIDAAFHMGFSNIILVGQNLGTVKNKIYSSGIDYQSSRITFAEQYTEIEKSVQGEEIRTSPTYLAMRHGIEAVIKVNTGDAKVWNATRHGLAIKGAEYKPLSELMKNMEEDIVTKEWIGNRVDVGYDVDNILEKVELLEVLKKECERQYQRLCSIVEDIKKDSRLGLFKKVSKQYTKLHFNLKRIEDNDYSALFILPAMVQEYHGLIRKIEHLNSIEDKEEQANSIYSEFDFFAKEYKKTLESIEPRYQEMIEYLKEYCERNKEHGNTN